MDENIAIIPKHKPDFNEKFFFFISGIIVSIPLTIFVDTFSRKICLQMPGLYADVCGVAILAPFVEEFSKAFPLLYRHGETEKSIFTLGFLVGLGFGIAEFFEYIFILGAPVIIRLPGIFFHASSTSITAYGIATKRPLPFYLIAVLLHLSYNFSTYFDQFWLIGPSLLMMTFFLSWHFYHKNTEKIVY